MTSSDTTHMCLSLCKWKPRNMTNGEVIQQVQNFSPSFSFNEEVIIFIKHFSHLPSIVTPSATASFPIDFKNFPRNFLELMNLFRRVVPIAHEFPSEQRTFLWQIITHISNWRTLSIYISQRSLSVINPYILCTDFRRTHSLVQTDFVPRGSSKSWICSFDLFVR